jgi:hypothetical protein
MHPELLSSLATQHRHDLAAARAAGRGGPRLALPRYRVSWSRANLAAVAGHRRARSLVIVISATRTL